MNYTHRKNPTARASRFINEIVFFSSLDNTIILGPTSWLWDIECKTIIHGGYGQQANRCWENEKKIAHDETKEKIIPSFPWQN